MTFRSHDRKWHFTVTGHRYIFNVATRTAPGMVPHRGRVAYWTKGFLMDGEEHPRISSKELSDLGKSYTKLGLMLRIGLRRRGLCSKSCVVDGGGKKGKINWTKTCTEHGCTRRRTVPGWSQERDDWSSGEEMNVKGYSHGLWHIL